MIVSCSTGIVYNDIVPIVNSHARQRTVSFNEPIRWNVSSKRHHGIHLQIIKMYNYRLVTVMNNQCGRARRLARRDHTATRELVPRLMSTTFATNFVRTNSDSVCRKWTESSSSARARLPVSSRIFHGFVS